MATMKEECPICDGLGIIVYTGDRCAVCNGIGMVEVDVNDERILTKEQIDKLKVLVKKIPEPKGIIVPIEGDSEIKDCINCGRMNRCGAALQRAITNGCQKWERIVEDK